ncbi:MAG TPA: prealbumin-like fold domain-containing protein, partial [Candidatus Angelobacter sp.]|nr:prealbumin-like fold domain-containing protein [Candidatus Angelobacter sp.]
MKLTRPWFRGVSACIVFFALFSSKLFGCVRSMERFKVPPSFRVSVWNDAKSVSGITIAVYKDASVEDVKPTPVLTLQTDQTGSAEVQDLAPGVYVIATTGPGQGNAAYAIVATNHPKPSSEVKLYWPYSQPTIKSHALAGNLISNKPWNPFENIHLELWTTGTSSPLAVTDTGPDGYFHFDEPQPGTYVLRIRGHQKGIKPDLQVGGDVAIELSPSAPEATEISLQLDMTDCGIEYNNCKVSDPVSMSS